MNKVTPRVRMTGLDPDKQYKLIDMTPLKENKKNFLDGKVLSGKLLLEEGVEVPFSGEYSSVVMQLIEVKLRTGYGNKKYDTVLLCNSGSNSD